MTQRTRLSQADWTDAALAAMASHGTAGVNVEQLARRLGTTKGSFYHHFGNRQDLLEAALARWEELIIADLTPPDIDDPRERLLHASLAGIESELDGRVDRALAADADDPAVVATTRRITQLRLSFITSILVECGLPPAMAEDRAALGLASYLGLYQLELLHDGPIDRQTMRRRIEALVDVILA